MRILMLAASLSLVACSGGSSKSDDPIVEPLPVPASAMLYEYTVTLDGESRSYTGEGVSINDVIYMTPKLLSSSGFSVVGEIAGDDVRLFDYTTRGLVAAFTNGDDSGYHLELEPIKELEPMSVSSVSEQWYNTSSAGIFGDTIMTLVNDNGEITGTDTDGCNVVGEIFELDSVIGIEIILSDCDFTGDYHGALRIEGDHILGAATSATNGIMFNYTMSL